MLAEQEQTSTDSLRKGLVLKSTVLKSFHFIGLFVKLGLFVAVDFSFMIEKEYSGAT